MDVNKYIAKLALNESKHINTLSSRAIPSDSIPAGVKEALDAIFGEMMDCKPSWRSAFKTKEEAKNYKKALGTAMARANIDTYEKARFGIAFAQLDESPFFPSVGQFVTWCVKGRNEYLRGKQMRDNTKRIMSEKRQISSVTFEERQERARKNISDLRKMIKKS